MSNRRYVCAKCGTLRRASAVYFARRETEAEAMASTRWPKHCAQPMKELTFIQAEAVTQLKQDERVKWVAKGTHVLRQRQRGNRKWKPVTADWQIVEAKSQKAAYPVRMSEYARIWEWRRRRQLPIRTLKQRRLAFEVEEI